MRLLLPLLLHDKMSKICPTTVFVRQRSNELWAEICTDVKQMLHLNTSHWDLIFFNFKLKKGDSFLLILKTETLQTLTPDKLDADA